ncbi:hypothetical protein LTR96_006384 [Exophiala xenobiotica]|nr:hypothetical protein LTR72_007737 [Exophiala xenobiotica]KAK5268677.1 hypothetical protein LTR96_006384 [Exophiala xenobiotica]KAK5293020.1 hypothetical protein LTR14_005369 [Exophiala xenobiotica]KAK5336871.1 hypothetical protein LTR98_007177 [Exophiala xenobiotica]KAK5444739.1 hypothetical protein LTR18_004443 [Exophiala xenobiotica]
MSSHDREQNEAPDPQSSSSSSEFVDTVPNANQPTLSTISRTSSVRFSDGTKKGHSPPPMSRYPRTSGDTDEITPIRTADGHSDRHYDTNGTGTTPTPAVQEEEEHSGKEEQKSSWLKRVADKYGSVALENKGSVARDHLALERTFLAWLRTSLAFASIGIAITQLFRLNTTIAKQQAIIPGIGLASEQIPFSPMIGQAVPPELIPYLQQLTASATLSVPTLGPTLLDQILLLPPSGANGLQLLRREDFSTSETTADQAAKLRHVGKPLGATFLGISIVILFIGFHRYFESQYWIVRGKFPASRGSIFVVGFIAGSLIVASLAVVLAIAPTSYEKK